MLQVLQPSVGIKWSRVVAFVDSEIKKKKTNCLF